MKKARKRRAISQSAITLAKGVPDESDINPYIDATISSGNRGRSILILIITSSILVFSAYWNSRSNSWLNSRIRVVEDAIYWWDFNAQNRVLSDLPEHEKYDNEDRLRRGAEYVQIRDIKDKAQLAELLRGLYALRSEQVNVIRIPFFGTAFDINDLGLLSGFSFVVLLMGFRFSLLRELFNVTLTFNVAKKTNQLEICYQRLAMHQVLHIPKILPYEYPRRQRLLVLWDNLPKLLFLLPVALQLVVFWQDLALFPFAARFYSSVIYISYAFELLFLILILVLTISCFRVANEISKIWRDTGEEVIKGPMDEVGHKSESQST